MSHVTLVRTAFAASVRPSVRLKAKTREREIKGESWKASGVGGGAEDAVTWHRPHCGRRRFNPTSLVCGCVQALWMLSGHQRPSKSRWGGGGGGGGVLLTAHFTLRTSVRGGGADGQRRETSRETDCNSAPIYESNQRFTETVSETATERHRVYTNPVKTM